MVHSLITDVWEISDYWWTHRKKHTFQGLLDSRKLDKSLLLRRTVHHSMGYMVLFGTYESLFRAFHQSIPKGRWLSLEPYIWMDYCDEAVNIGGSHVTRYTSVTSNGIIIYGWWFRRSGPSNIFPHIFPLGKRIALLSSSFPSLIPQSNAKLSTYGNIFCLLSMWNRLNFVHYAH